MNRRSARHGRSHRVEERIAITTPPTYTAPFDAPVTLRLDMGKMHLFDPETEQVVRVIA